MISIYIRKYLHYPRISVFIHMLIFKKESAQDIHLYLFFISNSRTNTRGVSKQARSSEWNSTVLAEHFQAPLGLVTPCGVRLLNSDFSPQQLTLTGPSTGPKGSHGAPM